jgi:hypothetical protein
VEQLEEDEDKYIETLRVKSKQVSLLAWYEFVASDVNFHVE